MSLAKARGDWMSVFGEAFSTFRVTWEKRDPDDLKTLLQRGIRRGQLAAAYAGASHALRTNDVGTIVMPTGGGKSAVMLLVAALVQAKRILIVVSSQALRAEIAEKFRTLDPFIELGLIASPTSFPKSEVITERPTSIELWEHYRGADVVTALPQSISPGLKGVVAAPHDLFDLVLFDEAHHAASATWSALLDQFANTPRLMFTATPYRLDGRPLPGRQVFTYSASQAFEEGVFGEVNYQAIEISPVDNADRKIRDGVIARYEADRLSGFDHRVLAKCKSIERAVEVAALYREAGFGMEVVHSQLSDRTNQLRIAEMRAGTLQGLAVVAMLGEGFDEPRLKIAGLHDQDRSLPITLQFIGRFARTTRPDIGPAHFISAPSATQTDTALRALYARDAIWKKLVVNLADHRAGRELTFEPLREALHEGVATARAPLGPEFWELLRPRQKAWVYDVGSKTLALGEMASALLPNAPLFFQTTTFNEGEIAICVEAGNREPGWAQGGVLLVQAATLYVAFVHKQTRLLFFHCSAEGLERTPECLKAIGASRLPKIDFERLNRIFAGEETIAPFNVGLRTRAHVFAAETYRSSLGRAAGDVFTSADGLRYQRGHCAARVTNDEIIGMSDASKVWGARNLPVDEFVEWCSMLASRIAGSESSEGLRGYFAMPLRKPIREIFRAVVAADWPPAAYVKNLLLVAMADLGESVGPISMPLREVEIRTRFVETTCQQMTLEFDAGGLVTKVVYKPASAQPFSEPRSLEGIISPSALGVRDASGGTVSFLDFLNDLPPTLFTLYGAAMVGREGLPELQTLSLAETTDFFETWNWEGVRIKDERRADDRLTVQDRAIEIISALRPDVLFFDDGSGELADLIAIKRVIGTSGEAIVTISLYHCKASQSEQPGARVADYYEVAGQALKSARRLAFADVREHLRRRTERGGSSFFLIGDLQLVTNLLSGDIRCVYAYEIAIVQPGLAARALTGLAAQGLSHLISLTRAMIDIPDFVRFRVICSESRAHRDQTAPSSA